MLNFSEAVVTEFHSKSFHCPQCCFLYVSPFQHVTQDLQAGRAFGTFTIHLTPNSRVPGHPRCVLNFLSGIDLLKTIDHHVTFRKYDAGMRRIPLSVHTSEQISIEMEIPLLRQKKGMFCQKKVKKISALVESYRIRLILSVLKTESVAGGRNFVFVLLWT